MLYFWFEDKYKIKIRLQIRVFHKTYFSYRYKWEPSKILLYRCEFGMILKMKSKPEGSPLYNCPKNK